LSVTLSDRGQNPSPTYQSILTYLRRLAASGDTDGDRLLLTGDQGALQLFRLGAELIEIRAIRQ
jgi:hypothetical protein